MRYGRFTSSQIYRLVGTKRVRETYLTEKAIERRMQSSLDIGGHSQSIAWGNFMEFVVFSELGLEYQITSNTTVVHPEFDFWAGSCDLLVPGKKIAEIKCYQKKNFALYTDCLLKKDIELFKKDFPSEYWQIVSNAIINKVDIGEGITYMPYESQHEELRDMAANYDGSDQWKYRFIAESPKEHLPLLKDGGHYKSINKFEFEIPKEDIQELTNAVLESEQQIKQF